MNRREVLKQYLMALLMSDTLSHATTKAEVMQAFGTAFIEDASAVMVDLAQTLTQNAAERIGAGVGKFALNKLANWFESAKKKGFRRAWYDLQEIYQRGVDANAENARRARGG
jgi:hypothetical protein